MVCERRGMSKLAVARPSPPPCCQEWGWDAKRAPPRKHGERHERKLDRGQRSSQALARVDAQGDGNGRGSAQRKKGSERRR